MTPSSPTWNSLPARRTHLLRRGRVSLAHARYVVTLRYRPRTAHLFSSLADAIAEAISKLERDGDWRMQTFTIMPDHLHLLFELMGRLPLSRCVAKFKGLVSRSLQLRLPANHFEHRRRPDETANPYAFYIFLNPSRSALLPRNSVWPYGRRMPDMSFHFDIHIQDGLYPPEEWLM